MKILRLIVIKKLYIYVYKCIVFCFFNQIINGFVSNQKCSTINKLNSASNQKKLLMGSIKCQQRLKTCLRIG